MTTRPECKCWYMQPTAEPRDHESGCPVYWQYRAKLDRKNAARRGRDAAMRSLGLVKVRGAQGGMYWE